MSEETMSEEAEQADDDRAELMAELAEVRKKYQASQAQVRWQARLIGDLQRQVDKMTAEMEEMTVPRDMSDAATANAESLRFQLSQCQAECDATREQLWRSKEAADMLSQENASLQDTVRILRDKQVHGDIPGLLAAIQGAAEQVRGLI